MRYWNFRTFEGIDTTAPFIGDRSSASTLVCNLESALSGGGCSGDTGGDD